MNTIENNKQVLELYNDAKVESMYDKILLNAEINLIKSYLRPGVKILDAGCGEGEGTVEYAKTENSVVHAADYSETRLEKAKERLKSQTNVTIKKIDFLSDYTLDTDYDFIICQRFLINLMQFDLQKKVLESFKKILKPKGRIIMLEGSIQGTEELNRIRALLEMEAIPVKWNNYFFDDIQLEKFMTGIDFRLIDKSGLGTLYLMSRGIKPYFQQPPQWNDKFNQIVSAPDFNEALNLKQQFSRTRLWVFEK